MENRSVTIHVVGFTRHLSDCTVYRLTSEFSSVVLPVYLFPSDYSNSLDMSYFPF